MRSLLVLGLISAFVVCGFLPAEMTDARAAGSLLRKTVVGGTTILVDVSKETSIVSLLSDSAGSLLPSTDEILEMILPDGKKRSYVADTIHAQDGTQLFEFSRRVRFAEEKEDPRLCGEFAPPDPMQTVQGFSAGDLTAFCLAAVTRDFSRCVQIDAESASVLKAACEQALVEPS